MIEFRDELGFQAEIVRRIASVERPLIGLDGAYRTGKSTIARSLAKRLGGGVLEVDKYLEQDGRPYRQQLRYADLRRDLDAMRAKGGPVIVEGVCLLHVLREIGATATLAVYVKRLDEIGTWLDEDTCDPKWINLEDPMLKAAGASLAREVAAYHREDDPLSRADIVLVKIG